MDVFKKKTLRDKLRSLSYMQVSIALFSVSAVLLILCVVLAVVTAGTLGLIFAWAGIFSLLISLAGLIVTLYGHFAVGMEGKLKWKLGAILNGSVFVIGLALYIIGAAS